MENGAEPLPRLAQLTPYSIRLGPVTVTGTLQVYFASIALATQFLNGTPTSFTLHLQSERGDRWVLSLPFVTFLGADTSVEGRDRDVFISFQWEATADPVRGFTISADLFPASTFTFVGFSTGAPPTEYFRLRDQTGVVWLFWINHAGQLARALESEGFVLTDETPVNITTGTVPYWHQVTDEVGGTWYLYPDTLGQLLMDTAPPATGPGLIVGLGQQVVGVDHAVYRLVVRSWWENQIETVDVTWRHVPRVWYFWIDDGGVLQQISRPLIYFPGMTALPIVDGVPPAYYIVLDSVGGTLRYITVVIHHPEYFRLRDQDDVIWFFWLDEAGQLARNTSLSTDFPEITFEIAGGTAPSWYQVTDELGGIWYIYPDTTGDLLLSSTPPALGSGLDVGLGQEFRGQDHLTYQLAVRSWQEIALVVTSITEEGSVGETLMVLSAPPAGVGVMMGAGLDIIATDRLLYRLSVTNGLLVQTLISSVCGV